MNAAILLLLTFCCPDQTPPLGSEHQLVQPPPLISADQPPLDSNAELVPEGTIERLPYDPVRLSNRIKFWRNRVERPSSSALDWSQLSRAYLARHFERGRIADAIEAERAATRALERVIDSGTLVVLGRALLAQHRFGEALVVVEEAAEVDPAAIGLRVDCLLELGELDRAIEAAHGFPADAEPLTRLTLEARLLEAQGDDEALLDRLRRLCELAAQMPQLPAELASWYHVRLGHALIDRGLLSEGRDACRAALSILPISTGGLVGLAEADAAETNWERSLRFAQRAQEINPDDFEAIKLAAEAQCKLGLDVPAERSITRLRLLVDTHPKVFDRHYIQFCLSQDRDLETALRLSENDLANRPDPTAYQLLLSVQQRLDHRKAAEQTIQAAQLRFPNDPQFRTLATELLDGEALVEPGRKCQ